MRLSSKNTQKNWFWTPQSDRKKTKYFKKIEFFRFFTQNVIFFKLCIKNEIILQKYTKELILNAIRSKINEISKKIEFFRFFTFCVIFMSNKHRKWDYHAKIHKRIDFERNRTEIKRNFKKNRIFSFFYFERHFYDK